MAVLIHDLFDAVDGTPWDPTIWPLIRFPRDPSPAMPTQEDGWGRMVTGTMPQSRICAFAEPTLADVDITVKYRGDPTATNTFFELGYRITTGVTTGDPGSGYGLIWEVAGNAVRLNRINAGDDRTFIAYDNYPAINDSAERFMRLRARGDRHQVKWWTASGGEPPGWKFDVTDTTYTAAGRVFLMMHALSAVRVADWDRFRLEEIVPPAAGIHVGSDHRLIDALYIGAEPVVAQYIGDVEVPVP